MAEKDSRIEGDPKQITSRGQSWKDVDVRELISIMQEETILYNMDNAKTPKEKRACYKVVHVQLQNKGIEFSLEAIINKWKKLKQQYKTHRDKRNKSGTERRKQWKFFDDMDQACGYRDTFSPVCLIDSSLGGFHDSEREENDSPSCELEPNEFDGQESAITDEVNVVEGDVANLGELEEVKMKGKSDLSTCKAKNVKKTKLEKSIEVLGNSFKAASEKESEMMMKLEQNRQKEMLEHEIRLKELDNERRRLERQHELLLLKMLSQNRNQAPSQDEISFNPSVMYGAPTMMNYMQSPESSARTGSSGNRPTYFKL